MKPRIVVSGAAIWLRSPGGDWVARKIVGHVQAGRAKFVVNSGDASGG
jgi:hypothetical protein